MRLATIAICGLTGIFVFSATADVHALDKSNRKMTRQKKRPKKPTSSEMPSSKGTAEATAPFKLWSKDSRGTYLARLKNLGLALGEVLNGVATGKIPLDVKNTRGVTEKYKALERVTARELYWENVAANRAAGYEADDIYANSQKLVWHGADGATTGRLVPFSGVRKLLASYWHGRPMAGPFYRPVTKERDPAPTLRDEQAYKADSMLDWATRKPAYHKVLKAVMADSRAFVTLMNKGSQYDAAFFDSQKPKMKDSEIAVYHDLLSLLRASHQGSAKTRVSKPDFLQDTMANRDKDRQFVQGAAQQLP